MSQNLISPQEYMTNPSGNPTARFAYGGLDYQFGELYMPEGDGPFPVVVVVHGGCWRAKYGLEPMGPACEDLATRGWAVWNLEYRRIGNGGGWPTTFEDIAAGIDYLRVISAAHALDLTRLVAVGHSAGGHLVSWLAARRNLPEDSQLYSANPLLPTGLVVLAGIPDLATAVARSICGTAPQELLSGVPEEVADHYRQASPEELLPLGVPHTHIVGSLDYVIPVDYLTTYLASATAAGDTTTLIEIPDISHFEIVTATHASWQTVVKAVDDLIG